jgi:hypothetical protein
VKTAVRRANEGRDDELQRVEKELSEKRYADQEQGRAIQKLVNSYEAEEGQSMLKSIKKRLVEHGAGQAQGRNL